MLAQFIFPFQQDNHPTFSQSKIRALWLHFPKIQLDPTQHMSTLQHAYFISNMLIVLIR